MGSSAQERQAEELSGGEDLQTEDAFLPTGSLVVILSQLEYASRGGAAPGHHSQTVRLRKERILGELRRRGLDFGKDSVDELPMAEIRTDPTKGEAVPAAESRWSAQDAASKIEHLERALVTRGTISQAMGILRERHHITAEQAFDVLRQVSSVTNAKLSDVSRTLVETGTLPAADRGAHRGPL